MPVEGHVEPGFERVRDTLEEQFAKGEHIGAAVCVYHRGRKVVDCLGRPRRRRCRDAVARGHARRLLLDDEGPHGDLPPHPRRPRSRRLRRAGRDVLAGVRAERQGEDHRLPRPHAPGRPRADAGGRSRARHLRLGPHHPWPRERGAGVGAGHGERLSRAHVRLPGRRDRASRERQAHRRVPARRSVRAARHRGRDVHRRARDRRAAHREAQEPHADHAGDDGALPRRSRERRPGTRSRRSPRARAKASGRDHPSNTTRPHRIRPRSRQRTAS